MAQLNEIRGRLALITGASGGIGAACARQLAERGVHLALTYSSNVTAITALVEELKSKYAGLRFSIHQVDVASAEQIQAMFEQIDREHGQRPDILVSNAGHGKRIPQVWDIPLEEFDYTINVNLRASFILVKGVVEHMKTQRWGRIVFMSSIAGYGGGINGCRELCCVEGRHDGHDEEPVDSTGRTQHQRQRRGARDDRGHGDDSQRAGHPRGGRWHSPRSTGGAGGGGERGDDAGDDGLHDGAESTAGRGIEVAVKCLLNLYTNGITRMTFFIYTTTFRKRPIAILQRHAMRDDLLLDAGKLAAGHEGNSGGIGMAVVAEDADNIDLAEGGSPDGERLHGVPHTDLDEHGAGGGGIDAGLHARRHTRAVVDAAEAHGCDAVCLLEGRSDALGVLQGEGRLVGVGRVAGRRGAAGGVLGDEEGLDAEAEGVGDGEAGGVDVRDDDVGEASVDGEGSGEEEADGAGAEDEGGGRPVEGDGEVDVGLGGRVGAAQCVQADGERLDEGAAGEGDVVRELVAHVGGVVGALHQGAVKMREDLRAAAELHVRADVVAAGLAVGAGATGQADLQSDAIAGLEAGDVGAYGGDDAGGLMAQTHGLAHDKVAIAAVRVVVQV
ncbi:sorbitol dehydrogenase [Aspergillus terreus NIH2624]|uniref:3-oxoacyl-[acyl-carrier-protein] reductase n=1 Tax=Aspergillus terreus (strain NIH 2624 / FGSC A1156) TaxID=341663 RepID=Q0D095_ASPTN|nr:sorbitol dehydrogenase [Aspergillus terreus NIH2624]EAU39285.1 sorbitol dehydrogenase [Aspergillus terreus NIH2624]